MAQFGIHEAKTKLSQLVERAEAGEEIIIARNGKPVARLVPVTRASSMAAMRGTPWSDPHRRRLRRVARRHRRSLRRSLRLLLDTHVALWWVSDDERLSGRAARHDRRHESTAAERGGRLGDRIKRSLGKLEATDEFAGPAPGGSPACRSASSTLARRAAPMASPRSLRPPARRSGRIEGAAIMSADEGLGAYGVPVIW